MVVRFEVARTSTTGSASHCRPDVSITVVPLAKGASPALRGSFTLLEFDKYPDVLFIEGPRGAAQVLNLHPNTLRSRLKKMGLARDVPTTPVAGSHEVS